MTSFDAFLSYSHAADRRLAPALQSGLERLSRPWYRMRALRLFRDQTNLSAHPDLWQSIENALSQARWFILLASEQAAGSKWVARELAWWLANRSEKTLLIVLTDGELVWSEAGAGLDRERSTVLPASLLDAFRQEPLFVDMRWARTAIDLDLRSVRFRNALLDIAAPLRGLSKDEMDGEAVRVFRRNRQWASAAVAAMVGASAWALHARHAATQEALRNELDLQARQVISQVATKRQAEALPLAMQAAERSLRAFDEVSPLVLAALRHGIEDGREERRWPAAGQVTAVAFDANDRELIALLRNGSAQRWTRDGQPLPMVLQNPLAPDADGDRPLLRFTPSRQAIVARTKSHRWRVWSLDGATLQRGSELQAHTVDVDAASRTIYLADTQRRILAYPANGGAPKVLRSKLPSDVKRLHSDSSRRWLVIVYEDDFIDVLSLTSHRVKELGHHCVEGSAMVRQGSALLVTGCGQARTIDLASGEVLQRSEHPALALVDDMTASDDGRFAVNHDADHRVQVFSHRGTLALSPLMGIEQPAISLSRDGRKLAMGGYLDRKVSVFDLDPRTSIRVADSNAGEEVIAFDFCQDRSQAFWGRDDGRLFSLDGDIEAGGRSRITNWSGSGSRVDLLRCLPGGGVIVQRRNLAVEHWLAPARMKTLVEEGGSSEGLSAGSTRRVAYALGPGHVVRWEADPQGMLKELPRLPLPLPEAGWKTLTLGRDDKLLALGSYNGDLAILDAASGRPVITPRRISWSNVWTLSRDVADRGFIAAGAGTGVSLFDWQGQSVRRFELDRFTFAAQPAYDSRRGLVAIQSAAGEVLVRDLQGNDIGPPIRPSTHDGIAVLQFTRDGRLFTVDPDYGVSAHEFAPRRLLTLACQLLNRRHIQAAESGTPTASVATGDCTPRR